jgi:hypothetical protein
MASYSCSIKGYSPLSQDYMARIELRHPLQWTVLERTDCTFTVLALAGPVPTKRREGAELLKFLFTDLKVPGRAFLNIFDTQLEAGVWQGRNWGKWEEARIIGDQVVLPLRSEFARRMGSHV